MSVPVELRLTRIGVIMLGTRDLERALGFYRDTLGLAAQFATPEFAFLSGGGVTLALSKPLAKAIEPLVGAVEIVFAVEDVHAAHEALVARGVTFRQAPRPVTGSEWGANFVDPDGHHLSLFGPPGAGRST